MWMDSPERRELIEALSRDIVATVAPEEVDLFDELLEEYFESPQPPDESVSASDDPLGFGVSGAIIAVTPAAAAMVSGVFNYLITEMFDAVKEKTAQEIKELIWGLINPQKLGKSPSPLTREQLRQIKDLASKQAMEFGIIENQAEKMANALVGSLVLSA